MFFAAENGHDIATSILVAYGADTDQKDVVKFSLSKELISIGRGREDGHLITTHRGLTS